MAELDDLLTRRARALPVPAGDIDGVITRAGARQSARRRVGRGLAAVAVLGGGVALVANREGGPTDVPLGVAGAARLVRGEPMLRWERVDPRMGLGSTATRVASGRDLFAVSTAAGTSANDKNPRRVPYRSSDGVDWTPLPGAPALVSNLASDGRRLFGVSTGAAGAAVSSPPDRTLHAQWSDDDGTTFQSAELPSTLADAPGVKVGYSSVAVATGAAGTVVLAILQASVSDLGALAPGTDSTAGWTQDDDGINLLGPPPACPGGSVPLDKGGASMGPPKLERRGSTTACTTPDGAITRLEPAVIGHRTWADLGLTGDILAAFRHQAIAFHAPPGSTGFTRVALPSEVRADAVLLEATEDGFTAITSAFQGEKPASTALSSIDGRTWTITGAPAVSIGWSGAALGRLAGADALIGGGAQGPALSVRSGGGWRTMSLTEMVDRDVVGSGRVDLVAAGIGGLGAVAVVSVTEDEIAKAGGVSLTDRGWTLRILDDRLAVELLDPTGAVVGRGSVGSLPKDGELREGAEGSVVAVRDGAEAARFTGMAIKQLFVDRGPTRPRYRILSSLDGGTWADEPFDTGPGLDGAAVIRSVVTGQRAVLTAQLPSAGQGVPPKQVALVGSRR